MSWSNNPCRIFAAALLLSAATVALSRPAAAEVPELLAHAAATEAANFDLYFPLRNNATAASLVEAQNTKGSPQYHKWLTPAEFQARFGPTSATIARVTTELAARGLTVSERHGLVLRVKGTAAAVEAAFGFRLNHARFSDGTPALVADRAPTPPDALRTSGAVTPQFTTVGPLHRHSHVIDIHPDNNQSSTGLYLARDLRQAYDYPAVNALTARGVSIGILMNGNYNPADIENYFVTDGLKGALIPSVASIPIDGGQAFDSSNSTETHLDIQQSGGIGIGANIGLYDVASLSNPVILFGLNTIVNDNIADVVNMSFGEAEANLLTVNNAGVTQKYIAEIFDWLFYQGALQGITFVASSGDHGAIPLVGAAQKATLSVEIPASDPNVLAVGGTNLVTAHSASSNTSAYVSENAGLDKEPGGEIWASGGGISKIFAQPPYQAKLTPASKWRMVPDVAQHMGGCPSDATQCHTPHSADVVIIGGQTGGVIGTSASAPDIAGLMALLVNFTGGRLGVANYGVYDALIAQNKGGAAAFHHAGIVGSNGKYSVKAPYDMVIGAGSVDARKLMGATKLPASGIPGTASNP